MFGLRCRRTPTEVQAAEQLVVSWRLHNPPLCFNAGYAQSSQRGQRQVGGESGKGTQLRLCTMSLLWQLLLLIRFLEEA